MPGDGGLAVGAEVDTVAPAAVQLGVHVDLHVGPGGVAKREAILATRGGHEDTVHDFPGPLHRVESAMLEKSALNSTALPVLAMGLPVQGFFGQVSR